jgi:hypothetical protein
MKTGSARTVKYQLKNNGDIVKARFDAQKDIMDSSAGTAADHDVTMLTLVQSELNDGDVLGNDRIKYYNFGRKLDKMVRSGVQDPALTTQATNARDTWVLNGCTDEVLVAIALTAFSITIAPQSP